MRVTAQEYNANLHLIHNSNPPTFAQLPSAEKIYKIDLQTREVEAPEFMGVTSDHSAETIYFEVDRFANHVDLSTVSCVITYVNAKGEYGIYIVPFYDISTKQEEGKMLIPWCLNYKVTRYEGTIMFAIRFFKTQTTAVQDVPEDLGLVLYDLNILPAKSKVLKSLEIPDDLYDNSEDDVNLSSFWYQQLSQRIVELSNYQKLNWIILAEPGTIAETPEVDN